MERGMYREAEGVLRQGIKFADCPDLRAMLGDAAFEQNDIDTAIENYLLVAQVSGRLFILAALACHSCSLLALSVANLAVLLACLYASWCSLYLALVVMELVIICSLAWQIGRWRVNTWWTSRIPMQSIASGRSQTATWLKATRLGFVRFVLAALPRSA